MPTLTKTITTDDGADITLERVTDDPAEITTLRASGWEQVSGNTDDAAGSGPKPTPPVPPVPAAPTKALTTLS
ncbi:hypothetical protein FK256_12310 [Actinomyces johnsonii]|uniref:Uncharacterized protein n=3 Tax=Actinomyces johnsonii TaxID=544581 RepID=U1RWZ9_9ACTO|nr:hypothetical protein [Actinomyces johnsonii]ERH15107.1 hypothetical protein HMPREF1549_03391 [Actinomyces johnsonii F0510]ERH24188.1 hypothetical protein HMPREF1979_01442 [Actinomyces johnsonii F0542]KAA8738490.1 hypothetical protein F4W10_10480 [Actinomyces johnsonii]TQD41773.1 hypothetical protein FK256_12310 [Actinomyces johnsonii]